MRNKISSLAGIALVATMIAAQATTSTVATVPVGMVTCALPGGSTSFLSTPLTSNAVYTSSVTAVTSNTITVGDSPAPFTSSLATTATPYFVKFLSGSEMGRVLLITGNTTGSLTLDTSDNTAQTVTLTTAGFSVAAGDTFEIIPAATLASTFGDGSTQHPLTVAGSTSLFTADSVGVYNPITNRWKTYYYNTAMACWEGNGSTVNANSTILYPNGAMTVTRRNTTDASIVMSGKVTEVPALIKTPGSNSVVFSSTGYASDMKLSQLQFGQNWVKSDSLLTASTVSIWNMTTNRFDTYYQKSDSTWRKSADASTDVSNTVVAGSTSVSILQRTAVSGGSSFLPTTMPYSL